MSRPQEKTGYYFELPTLTVGVGGRFVVRLCAYAGYSVATVGGIMLWLSDVRQLHAIGALTMLFLLSRLLEAARPEFALAQASVQHPNIAQYLSPATTRLLEKAMDKAELHGGDVQLYLLRLLTDQREVRSVLVRLDVAVDVFVQKIEKHIQETKGEQYTTAQRRGALEAVCTAAFHQAIEQMAPAVEPYLLFGALGAAPNQRITHLYTLFSITSDDVQAASLAGAGAKQALHHFVGTPFRRRHRVMNRAWTARPTPTLDQFGIDVTDEVRSAGGALLVGHRGEYELLAHVLSRPGKPHALLVGDPGSGRSAIINYLAFQINRDRVAHQLFDHRLVTLSVSDVATGVPASEAQERLKKILREVTQAGNVVLCIPNIHLLLKSGGGGEGQFSGADLLLPAIRANQFSVIGTTYHREFKELIEPNRELLHAFEPITVNELSEAEAVRYLLYASLVLEAQTGITITFKAVREAVTIAHKYFHQQLLPGSAEDLLKEALATAAQQHSTVLTAPEIIAVAEQKVNITMHSAERGEREQLLHLEEAIHEQFVGQEEAVRAVSEALREYRAGVNRAGGPIASFLFCGPTGVGKTELSKILAQTQFGSRQALLRFDMTEYQEVASLQRLIGSPQSSGRGLLTEAVVERPYSLILLDEFEKAHPDVLNLFLQVLDDGRLTDGVGRTADFQHTIIIATSNAHSTLIKEQLEQGKTMAGITEQVKQRLTEYFKPELINRFSKIVVFKPLTMEQLITIAQLNLADLSRTLAQSQAVTLRFSPEVIQEVARRGYDPVFGARPLRQAINESLRSVLADAILRGEIHRGQTIMVNYRDDNFVFEAVEA